MVSPDRDTITISVYLNDDYEGGEIAVVEDGLDISIKTKAGSIVIFPSSYHHASKFSPSGQKMIITHVHMPISRVLD
jgi:predicted 2-oxoglutarate/Fe(II)-dependent dioxygenase YbiX